MTPQELKASILQLAIQGKLVPQIPEEGTGEELFRQIQMEKLALIKAGKIKKEKSLPEITEDEIPFDIPDSWKWIKLGEVASVLGGKRIPAGRTLTADNTGYKYIRVSDMKNGSVLTENLLYVPTDIYPSISHYVIHKEDVYITVAGTIGRVGKIPPEIDGANLTENADRLVFSIIDQDWLIKCLESSLVQQQIIDATTKVGQPKLAIKRIQELLIPLPPLDEQKRIVAKIEELLPLIDRYEQAWSKLEEFNKRFPVDMQKSILQMAIQGKLVPQIPEEGTGEELFQQIQTEKQALIKEGKIKKEKPLVEIAEDELPFDIPDSWKWVRLPEIGTSSLGKTLNKGLDIGNEVPYLCSINVYWDGINLNQIKTAKFSAIDMEKYLLRKGDLLICEGGDVGRSAVWDRDMEMYYQNALHCVRFFGSLNPYYFKYCLELYKHNRILENASKGMTIKHLVQGALYSIPFPLPPLDEQNRIVTKLEEILPLCERLK